MAIFLHERMLIVQVSTVMVVAAAAAAAAQLALPNCPDHCGNVTIPYPFGVNENCYMNRDYFINCTKGTAYLRRSNIRVTNISVDQAELQIQQYLAHDCYDGQGNRTYNTPELWVSPPYTISGAKNKFMAVGCDTQAKFEGFRSNNDQPFIAGCLSQCLGLDTVDQNSCSGIGCCQTSIPDGLKNHTVDLGSFNSHSRILDFNPCSYAFIVQEGQFNFSGTRSFQQLANISQLPMVLSWEIAAPNKSQNFACKENTKFVNPIHHSGYICQCLRGYEGNPYHPNGCQGVEV